MSPPFHHKINSDSGLTRLFTRADVQKGPTRGNYGSFIGPYGGKNRTSSLWTGRGFTGNGVRGSGERLYESTTRTGPRTDGPHRPRVRGPQPC